MEQQLAPNQDPKKTRSIGEKIFDWFTYAGIAGVGTFLATLPLAYWQKYGGGKNLYDKAAGWFSERGVDRGTSKSFLETNALMHGGNAILLVVALVEHFKVPIVQGLNRLFNDDTDPASIQEAPKQTAGSLILGRMIAWGSVFAGLFSAQKIFPETFKQFENEFARRLCQLTGRANKTLFRYGKLAALDVFATATSATLLYIGSHFFARQAVEKQNKQASATPAKEELAQDIAVTDKTDASQTKGSPVKPEEKPASQVHRISRQAHLANVVEVNQLTAG